MDVYFKSSLINLLDLYAFIEGIFGTISHKNMFFQCYMYHWFDFNSVMFMFQNYRWVIYWACFKDKLRFSISFYILISFPLCNEIENTVNRITRIKSIEIWQYLKRFVSLKRQRKACFLCPIKLKITKCFWSIKHTCALLYHFKVICHLQLNWHISNKHKI